MENNTSSRKWQLTINNPADRNMAHDNIKLILYTMTAVSYYCLSDEVGLDTHTPHTHIFLYAPSGVRFSTVKNQFPDAHIERVRGTASENRDYIAKSGKWEDDPKADTSIPGTFEEWGELPDEPGQGYRTDVTQMYNMIVEGMSNAEIMAENPELAAHISRMDKIRLDILEARFKEEWRDLTVTYIFGPTATGKTRGVMEKHGYSNVYRVTDYKHPFDRYAQEPVLCLDEFRSSLMVGDMLDYLDGFPLALPARYANRQACFTEVYIISNIDLTDQYPNVQLEELATWRAFLRRIHHVIEYKADGSTIDHGNATDYIYPPARPLPDWVDEDTQEKLPF